MVATDPRARGWGIPAAARHSNAPRPAVPTMLAQHTSCLKVARCTRCVPSPEPSSLFSVVLGERSRRFRYSGALMAANKPRAGVWGAEAFRSQWTAPSHLGNVFAPSLPLPPLAPQKKASTETKRSRKVKVMP